MKRQYRGFSMPLLVLLIALIVTEIVGAAHGMYSTSIAAAAVRRPFHFTTPTARILQELVTLNGAVYSLLFTGVGSEPSSGE